MALEGEALQVNVLHKFSISCDELSEGELDISCGDGSTSSADATATWDSENHIYNCTILPKQVGHSTISIRLNKHHIIGSPFNVEFTSEPSPANLTFSLASSTGVETSDMTASVETLPDHQQIPVQLSQLLGNQYGIEFVPTDESEYCLTIKCLLKVKRKEIELAGGNFALTYFTQPVQEVECKFEGKGIASCEVGSWSQFTVQSEDPDFGDLSAEFEDSESVSAKPVITKLSPDKYEVKYLAKKTGNFNILLYSHGAPIVGSPFNVTCSPPATTISTATQDLPAIFQLGQPMNFSFQLEHQPTTSGQLQVSAYSESAGLVLGTYKMSEDTTTYHCTLQLDHLGVYLVTVIWDNQPIAGMPFEVVVLEPSKPENVRVHGQGLAEGTADEKGSFTIDTEEAGYGTLVMTVTGPEARFLQLERDSSNERRLLVGYHPRIPGSYKLEILWEGVPVPNSPFMLSIN